MIEVSDARSPEARSATPSRCRRTLENSQAPGRDADIRRAGRWKIFGGRWR